MQTVWFAIKAVAVYICFVIGVYTIVMWVLYKCKAIPPTFKTHDQKWTEVKETVQELHDVHKDNPDIELVTRFLYTLMNNLETEE